MLINYIDRTELIADANDTSIRLTGSAKKLNIKSGENTVQLANPVGTT